MVQGCRCSLDIYLQQDLPSHEGSALWGLHTCRPAAHVHKRFSKSEVWYWLARCAQSGRSAVIVWSRQESFRHYSLSILYLSLGFSGFFVKVSGLQGPFAPSCFIDVHLQRVSEQILFKYNPNHLKLCRLNQADFSSSSCSFGTALVLDVCWRKKKKKKVTRLKAN